MSFMQLKQGHCHSLLASRKNLCVSFFSYYTDKTLATWPRLIAKVSEVQPTWAAMSAAITYFVRTMEEGVDLGGQLVACPVEGWDLA
jgi:hypothetical protein